MAEEVLPYLDRIEKKLDVALSHRPLTAEEAADYLSLSMSGLYQLTSRNQITYYKPGGKRLYFFKEDLDAFLRKHRSGAEPAGSPPSGEPA